MPLAVEERKARRIAGMERMTTAQKAHRAATTGRPPVSEMKSPMAAISAARALHKKLESEMRDQTDGDYFAVSIAFVIPDLSALGFTHLYSDSEHGRIERALDGNVPIGLVFGIADGAEILMGARPFIAIGQTDAWLKELMMAARIEMESDRLERQ